MAEFAVIKNKKQKVNEEAREMVRNLLGRVESGEVETVFAVAWRPDGRYQTLFSASLGSLEKAGALECLKIDYLRDVANE